MSPTSKAIRTGTSLNARASHPGYAVTRGNSKRAWPGPGHWWRRPGRAPARRASVWPGMGEISELTGSELFSSLDEEGLARVALRATTLKLDRNDMLFREGDMGAELFVVLRGRVGMAKSSPDGRESLVALMEAGDVFGEMPMFDDEPRSASARALERSEVLRIPFDVVREELEARPDVLWDVVSLFARRLRTVDESLADAMLLDVTGRTAKRLLELSAASDEFVLPITQEELAGLVGASRERVNKAIATFIRLGWIEQSDRRYRILNRERLAQRAR